MCIAGYWINVSANCSSSFAYLHLSGCVVPSGRGRHSGDSHDMTATEMAVSDSNLQLFHGHDNQFSCAFERNCSRSSTPAIALNTFKHNRFIEYVLFFFMTCLKHCNFMVPNSLVSGENLVSTWRVCCKANLRTETPNICFEKS